MSVKIMAAIWELDLPRDEKIVALAFSDHADDSGMCFPSIERIAWKCGYSDRSVQRKISALRDRGILVVMEFGEGGRGHATVHQVIPSAGTPLEAFNPSRKGDNLATVKGDNPSAKGDTGDAAKGDSLAKKGDAVGHLTTKEPSLEPSKNQVIVGMWETWTTVTGRKRLQLTANRKARLVKVHEFVRKADSKLRGIEADGDRVTRVWRQMITKLWSDPWRQESLSRYDPVNVFRGPEQIESHFLDAHDFLRNIDRSNGNRERAGADRIKELDQEMRRTTLERLVAAHWTNATTADRDRITERATELAAKDFPGLSMDWVKRVTMKAATAEAAGVDLSTSAT